MTTLVEICNSTNCDASFEFVGGGQLPVSFSISAGRCMSSNISSKFTTLFFGNNCIQCPIPGSIDPKLVPGQACTFAFLGSCVSDGPLRTCSPIFGGVTPVKPFGISLVSASVRVSTAGRC